MGGAWLTRVAAAMLCVAGMHVRAASPADCLPATATIIAGYTDVDSIEARIGASAIHPIEGIWRMTADGALIAIERSDSYGADRMMASGYRIVVIQSPCRRIRPGTLMGYALPSAKPGRYDASIFTDIDNRGLLHRHRRFSLDLRDNESRLAFIHHRTGLRVSLWRLIPYLFRVSVRTSNDRPNDMDGAIRIYPAPDSSPVTPRYL